MCQILILTNTSKLKNNVKTVNKIASYLQETQKDGFGYSILGESGVYGERTTRQNFSSRLGLDGLNVRKSIIEVTYNKFGVPSKNVGAGIFHGRTSTNDKTLLNTHPINKDGWTLIHNGVVTNHGPAYKMQTTNDTEHLVHHLSTIGMSAIEEHITGYYAIGAIDPQGNLHVIKDSTARLYVAFNKTLDCHMFATTESLITRTAKALKWTVGPVEVVKDNVYIMFKPNGDIVAQRDIEPRGYSDLETRWAGQSLGRSIEPTSKSVVDFKDAYYAQTSEQDLYDLSDGTSQDAWQEEIDNMDASYEILDHQGHKVTVEDFHKMDVVSQSECTIYRADGTIVDCEDYWTEKIA